MNIIQAIHSEKAFKPLFKDLSTWHSWEVYLMALFGLGIEDKKDKRLFRKRTGLRIAPKEQAKESFLVVARRSGKSFISSIIAVFLAVFKDWSKFLSPGERGWIFIVAVDKAQAGIIKGYISDIFNSNKMFKAMIERETKEEIHLKNHVSIAVKTCNFRTLRGYTVLCAILEEIAFWRSEDSANPDKEILAALRPAMATVEEGLLIGISSPYSRSGVLWEQFRAHYGKPGGPLIWRAPTEVMNPTIDRKLIKNALKEDYASAKSEWLAEWREDIEAFLSLEMIEAVIIPGRFELPKIEDATYFAFCDPSGGRQDSMTMAITHKDKDGKIVLDVIREVRPPFKPKAVVEEFSETLKNFAITSVESDRYAAEWVSSEFSDNGITVKNSELSASEIYMNFLPLLANGTIELLDHKRLIAQLRGLERKTRSGGKDLITHYPGGHDDIANAVGGAVVMSSKKSEGYAGWSKYDWRGEFAGKVNPYTDIIEPAMRKERKYIKENPSRKRKYFTTGDIDVSKK